jgi:hypothetical protein
MRFVSKLSIVAVGLLAIGISSSSIRANELAGKFTLPHATVWKSTVLPAGDYTFMMTHGQADTNLLKVRGKNQSLEILVFAQSACAACRNGQLSLGGDGQNRVVTSLELPGYHMDFNDSVSASAKRELARMSAAPSEQVAVHVNSN